MALLLVNAMFLLQRCYGHAHDVCAVSVKSMGTAKSEPSRMPRELVHSQSAAGCCRTVSAAMLSEEGRSDESGRALVRMQFGTAPTTLGTFAASPHLRICCLPRMAKERLCVCLRSIPTRFWAMVHALSNLVASPFRQLGCCLLFLSRAEPLRHLLP